MSAKRTYNLFSREEVNTSEIQTDERTAKFLDTEPVHLASDAVVVGQVLDGADGGDDGTLVVDVLEANRLHQVGVDSLEFMERWKTFVIARKSF